MGRSLEWKDLAERPAYEDLCVEYDVVTRPLRMGSNT